jgi:hypothetical protein
MAVAASQEMPKNYGLHQKLGGDKEGCFLQIVKGTWHFRHLLSDFQVLEL